MQKKTPETKTCRICGEQKTPADFYVSKAAKDGRESLCKECKHRLARERTMKKKEPKGAVKAQDTIRKNNHPVEMDEMVKRLLEQAGHPGLYDALEKQAHNQFRTPALQAVAIISGSV
jgi:NMD protein affecting ribosome stability and mRNA decay